MAKLELDDALARRLEAQAQAAGQPVERFISDLLDAALWLDDSDDAATVEEFERTGVGIPADEVVDWLKAGGDASGLPFPKARTVG